MLMLSPDGGSSGTADTAGGSADNGTPAPGNAEDSLKGAFTESAAGTKPAAKPEGDKAAGGTQDAGTIKLAAWADQLPPELKGTPEQLAKLAKFAKVGDLASAYFALEGTAAASVAFPGTDATPEEVAAFWEKAGKPKTADAYAFAADAEKNGATFARAAFEANLTSDQAAAMFTKLNATGAAKLQAFKAAQDEQIKATSAALAAEYGAKYEEKVELLKRGLAAAGPHVATLLSQAGLAGNPEIVKAFIAFGQMTAESGASRGGQAGAPVQSVFEGGSFDYTQK
jgi:hypothetical protein